MKRLFLLLAFLAASCLPSFATWTKVQQTSTYCGDSTSTCSVPITTPGTGNLIAIAAVYNGSTITISSATGAGTWVHPVGCNAVETGFQAIDWAYTLSATSATSISVTMSGTAQFLGVFVFEYSGSGPFTFDTCGVSSNPASTTSVLGGSITTTGTNDLAISGVNSDQAFAAGTVISPAPPWTSPAISDNDTLAFAQALNFGPQTTQAIFPVSSAAFAPASTIAFKDTSAPSAVRKRVTAMWSRGGNLGGGGTDFMAQIANDTFSVTSQTGTGITFAGFYEVPNEAHPHGWPYEEWSVFGDMNANTDGVEGQITALESWGVVYVNASVSSGISPAPNTRVNIGPCTFAYKPTSGSAWIVRTFVPGDYDEALYPEDFSGPATTSTARTETDGTWSVIAGGGYTSHWNAPFPRLCITGATSGGACTTPVGSTYYGMVHVCQARLILSNPAGTDDRALAKYIMEVGADPYTTNTGAGVENSPAVGAGRFKIVTNNWRSFAFTTLTYSQLHADPPPIDLTGILP